MSIGRAHVVRWFELRRPSILPLPNGKETRIAVDGRYRITAFRGRSTDCLVSLRIDGKEQLGNKVISFELLNDLIGSLDLPVLTRETSVRAETMECATCIAFVRLDLPPFRPVAVNP